MGFLSSRRELRDPDHTRRHWTSASEPYSMERRPTFGQWLKVTWLDILTMIILAVISAMIYRLRPAATRTFPLTVLATGEVVYPQFAYPYRPQILAPWLDAFVAAAVPIAVILAANAVRVRSFWDTNNGIVGLVYALLASSCFQVFIKWIVGGLRPHFYDVCRPDPSLFNAVGLNHGVGYQNYMFTPEVCTGSQESVRNALESFPSGHATTIFAGMVYLYLYLNAKLKVFSNYHPAMWKLLVLYMPILGACLIAGTLTIDHSHNWYDIIAGAVIGTVFAFSAYRMVYAAIWDYRMNHIPLNRSSAFSWSEGCEGSDMVFTREVGWGAGSLHGDDRDRSPTHNGNDTNGRSKNKNGQEDADPGRNVRNSNVHGAEMV